MLKDFKSFANQNSKNFDLNEDYQSVNENANVISMVNNYYDKYIKGYQNLKKTQVKNISLLFNDLETLFSIYAEIDKKGLVVLKGGELNNLTPTDAKNIADILSKYSYLIDCDFQYVKDGQTRRYTDDRFFNGKIDMIYMVGFLDELSFDN